MSDLAQKNELVIIVRREVRLFNWTGPDK